MMTEEQRIELTNYLIRKDKERKENTSRENWEKQMKLEYASLLIDLEESIEWIPMKATSLKDAAEELTQDGWWYGVILRDVNSGLEYSVPHLFGYDDSQGL